MYGVNLSLVVRLLVPLPTEKYDLPKRMPKDDVRSSESNPVGNCIYLEALLVKEKKKECDRSIPTLLIFST